MQRVFFCLAVLGIFLYGQMSFAFAAALPADFCYRGLALGDTEAKVHAILGTPLFEKERMVYGRRVRFLTFPHKMTVGILAHDNTLVDITVADNEFTLRDGIRYGATSYKIEEVFGKRKRVFLDGATCYVYTNPQKHQERLLLVIDPTDGHLISLRWTSLPLTDEEADARASEEEDWNNNDVKAIELRQKNIADMTSDRLPPLIWDAGGKKA